jgi:translation elongation factor EF-G
MMKFFSAIQALKLPIDDRLSSKAISPFFRDALQTPLSQTQLTPSQVQYAIFNYLPKWVSGLMQLRNKLVRVFGFEVGQTSMKPTSDELKVGDKAGFLTIIEKSDDEIISQADDKHMTFYLSGKKLNNTVIISSLVNQKTGIGRIYVNAVLPFHYFIARIVINNAIKAKRI